MFIIDEHAILRHIYRNLTINQCAETQLVGKTGLDGGHTSFILFILTKDTYVVI